MLKIKVFHDLGGGGGILPYVIPQLLICPTRLMQTERAIMHTILRLPQNALCHSDFFHLGKVGGPKFRSIVASCAAALFRTASRTVTTWPDWIVQLEIAAQSHLPLNEYVKSNLSPAFWDSPPIACNLREAQLGFPRDSRWHAGATSAIQTFQASTSDKVQLQRVLYCKLIEHNFVYNLPDTVKRRLETLFQPYTLDFQNAVDLEGAFGILKGCRVSDAMKVLKCWINGWATSYRYHEDKLLPCLLGCDCCKDELSHYLQCPHLFALWKFLAGSTSEVPLVRWGLIQPNKLTMQYISCIFSGYHAVRRDFRDNLMFFEYNQSVLKPAQLRRAWSVFADAFKVEARELLIYHRQFSLPDFLIYIQ